MEEVRAIRLRGYWPRKGATIARISALPVFLISTTGWIPSRDLDLPPKGPWPWGAIAGAFLIATGIFGIFLPDTSSTELPSNNAPDAIVVDGK
jgi:hypothetical protein